MDSTAERIHEATPQRGWPREVVGLLLLAALAYAPTLGNGFTWDDEYVLLRNPAVRSVGNLPAFFSAPATSASAGGPVHYRPLRTTALALAYGAWGTAPLGYHVLNLLLHLVNVLLVHALARRLLVDRGPALLAAALFAAHPLGTEAVASVVGLGDLLSAAFLLGAMRLHVDLTDVGRGERAKAAAVVLLFAGALLSKESALAFPILALWTDAALAGRRGWPGRSRLAYLAALVVVAAGFLALRTALMGGLGAGEYEGITFARTMWMQADVLARYVRLLLLPAGLSVRHPIPVPFSFLEPRTLLSAAFLLASLGVAAAARRRLPPVTWGIGWFFAGLLPVMNVIPLPGTMMGERFCYVPAVGAFVALAAAAGRAPWAGRRGAVAAAVVLAALGVATFARCLDWRDNLTLFEAAVRVAPESNAVRLNLAREYALRDDEARARQQLEAAAENTRASVGRYVELGERLEAGGGRREAAAWFERALRLDPADPRAHAGIARLRDGR